MRVGVEWADSISSNDRDPALSERSAILYRGGVDTCSTEGVVHGGLLVGAWAVALVDVVTDPGADLIGLFLDEEK